MTRVFLVILKSHLCFPLVFWLTFTCQIPRSWQRWEPKSLRCKVNMIYVCTVLIQIQASFVPEGTEASFSVFLLLFSQSDTKNTHKHTTMPVKTAGGPSVPHTGEHVNRPSGAQFIHNTTPLRKTHTFNLSFCCSTYKQENTVTPHILCTYADTDTW